ncbi:MAG: DNA-3-methyladenine glycosylase I [Flavobacteriaceae bacterium]|nr:DNA-3-methyladenine glycosylase [Flavobacteriaceae bacterium]
MSYCSNVNCGKLNYYHNHYHDNIYGFPAKSENELFGRLVLEINQAGLSWDTVLKKEKAIKDAYRDYSFFKIAEFNNSDIQRILNDNKVIRMKSKIEAIIYNAKKIISVTEKHNSFKNFLDMHHPLTMSGWLSVFKNEFKFVGKEICKEFLMSTGYIKGAHEKSCPIYKKVIREKPMWLYS